MRSNNWPEQFRTVFDDGVARYRGGRHAAAGFFSEPERAFLAGIGCTEQELFDFVEDFCNHGEPSFETALLVQAARRDYFLSVQGGAAAGSKRPVGSFPGKTAELAGIAWLPRFLAKARAKLRGELPPELMYG